MSLCVVLIQMHLVHLENCYALTFTLVSLCVVLIQIFSSLRELLSAYIHSCESVYCSDTDI